jgi:trigger factor
LKTHDHSHETTVKKIDHLSKTKVRLTVELPADMLLNHERATTQRYVNQAKIPGFRPGKAPFKMVHSKFRDEIRRDVVSHLLESGLGHALEKANLQPVNQPKIELVDVPFDGVAGKAFEFHAEFDIQPPIELKDYKSIPLKATDVSVIDDEVTKTLENLRDRFSTLEPATEELAQKGMFVVAEIEVDVPSVDGKKEPKKSYTLEVGEGKLLPELDKALVEMKVGESRTITEKFPDDYDDKVVAGKEGIFQVQVLEIKKKVMPDLNDAFAAQIKDGNTMESLKAEITESISSAKSDDAKSNQRRDILDYLCLHNSFEVPESMVERQTKSLIDWMQQDMKRRGGNPTPLSDEELKSVKKRAENMVLGSLLLKEVAIKEKILLDESRLDAKIESIASQAGRSVEDAKQSIAGNGMLDRLRDEVLTDQVFDFLIKNAQILSST